MPKVSHQQSGKRGEAGTALASGNTVGKVSLSGDTAARAEPKVQLVLSDNRLDGGQFPDLMSSEEEFSSEKQLEFFEKIQKNCLPIGILFSWKFETTIHARHIVTDTGRKILLDRGLDVFQRYDANDSFAISNRLQKHRSCKAFEVTYLRK